MFLFGSEIKALLAHPDVSRELNLTALDQIFTFWCRVPPDTFFKNVMELPPGHSLVVERRELCVWPHWQLDFSEDAPRSVEDSSAQLFHLLADSTRIRLRSDVPVGAYLSGGLDSTITAGLIRKFSSARLQTFSVRFDDPEFDESRFQQQAVRHLNTDHQELRSTSRDIAEVFLKLIWQAKRPIFLPPPPPCFLLS